MEEKEERIGSILYPAKADLQGLHHQAPMPSGCPQDQSTESPGMGLIGGKREKWEYLVPQLPPYGVTSGWLPPPPCDGQHIFKWPSSHWDSRSYSLSSLLHPLCYQHKVIHYSVGFPTPGKCLCKQSDYSTILKLFYIKQDTCFLLDPVKYREE